MVFGWALKGRKPFQQLNLGGIQNISWKYLNIYNIAVAISFLTLAIFCCQFLSFYSAPLIWSMSFVALRPMDSGLCLSIPPNTTQLCHISCPVECEVSPWSAWGPCTYENCQDQSAKKGMTFYLLFVLLCALLLHDIWDFIWDIPWMAFV